MAYKILLINKIKGRIKNQLSKLNKKHLIVLDQYIIGVTDEKDSLTVEHMISKFPEIKFVFHQLE